MNTKSSKYLLISIIILSFSFLSLQNDVKEAGSLKYYTFEEALALQEKFPKKMIVDVYTDWCGWCKKMDKNTYTDPAIIAAIEKDYYFVKFNAEQKEDVKFRENILKYKEEYKSHELAVNLLQGKMSYPSTVFLDEHMTLLTIVPGYLTPKDLAPVLTYFGENHYKKMNWEEFSGQRN
jgi:thioredoxin-related protein